jgi:hypothetical protein
MRDGCETAASRAFTSLTAFDASESTALSGQDRDVLT